MVTTERGFSMAIEGRTKKPVVEVLLRRGRQFNIWVDTWKKGMEFAETAIKPDTVWVTLSATPDSGDDAIAIRTADIVSVGVKWVES